jgi:hypothetical protein
LLKKEGENMALDPKKPIAEYTDSEKCEFLNCSDKELRELQKGTNALIRFLRLKGHDIKSGESIFDYHRRMANGDKAKLRESIHAVTVAESEFDKLFPQYAIKVKSEGRKVRK